MRQVIFNIGLNNNPNDFYGMLEKLSKRIFSIQLARLGDGEYNGEIEPTLIAWSTTHATRQQIVWNVALLCEQCKQEVIAVKINGEGVLVAPSGEVDGFNEKYFIV